VNYLDAGQATFLSTNDLSGVTAGLHGANLGAANLTGQYSYVKVDASNANQIVLASAATDHIIGVVMNAPAANDNAVVRLRNASGTYPVVAGGTITRGDWVTSDANGNAITTTTSGNEICGVAKSSASSGDIVEVISYTGSVH
jgi:hypothetical protein